MVGQTISHYRITEKLGEASMCVIFQNEHPARQAAL